MTDAERLLAIEEIKRLFARRIRAMDTKDWALYDTCHAPDATLNSFSSDLPEEDRPPNSIVRGKAQILAAIKKTVDGKVKLTTVHHAHTPEIDITSPTTAKGMVMAALAYFVLPVDAIPDILPVIGYTDDAAVLAAVVTIIGRNLKDSHRAAAAEVLARMRED